MAETQTEKEDVREWFLRINGETVFGPVSTQGLIVWAEQGRILPGHEVSNDRKKWVQAVSVELLDMRWFVDDGQGELRGPLNRLAAEALLKSGKVSEEAQIVSADEIETEDRNDSPPPQEKHAERVHEPMPEEVLRGRIRELEALVSTQRERLSKLSDAAALETIQHERDVLATLVKETESQRDTILRNAEKDARAGERKQESLRQQIKKLEQQLEDANSRLLLSAEVSAQQAGRVDGDEAQRLAEEARRAGAEEVRAQADADRTSLQAEVGRWRAKAEAAEKEMAEMRESLSQREASLHSLERKMEDASGLLAARDAELAATRKQLEACEKGLAEAEAACRKAEDRVREGEAAFAELLNDANQRDAGYQEKIAGLEKACSQSPDEIARFFADRAAVYNLIKTEADAVAKSMELERKYVEQLREWSALRMQTLTDRRQALLKHMGDNPDEMTRRALREQPSDPQTARLRAELENLRVTYQREVKFSETREREWQEKLRVMESENARLKGQSVEHEKRAQQSGELEDQLRRREHELADERRTREAEREQFLANQQALLLRIESLEKTARPSTPDEIQTAEARNVKLASWMRLKR